MLVSSGKSFVILNGLRGLTILSLLIAACGASASMVLNIIKKEFFFFAFVRNVLLVGWCAGLIVTELSLFKDYLQSYWPLLGPYSSLVTLGASEIVLSIFLLGTLSDDANSKRLLGGIFYGLLIGGGATTMFTGVLNIGTKFVFYDPEYKLGARAMRSRSMQHLHADPEKGLTSPISNPMPVIHTITPPPPIYADPMPSRGPTPPVGHTVPLYTPPNPGRAPWYSRMSTARSSVYSRDGLSTYFSRR